MKQEQKKGIHDAIATLLEQNLKQYADERKLNLAVCTRIYQTIFDSLVQVLERSNVQLQNESVNYLAQQYYDGILINNRHELDPNIFTQRAKLENIETKELALLATMMAATDFRFPILAEIKRRN